MNSDSRKFLIMGGIAVVILIAIFFYTLSRIFGPEDTTGQVISPFPESGDRTDIALQADGDYVPFTASSTDGFAIGSTNVDGTDTDDLMDSVPDILRNREAANWRDPVLSFSGQTEEGVTEPVTSGSGAGGSAGSPYTGEDFFRDTGLMADYPDPSLFYPKTVTLGDGTVMNLEDALDFDKFNEATYPIPSLADEFEGVKSCGTIQLPTTDKAVESFFNRLHEYEPVICMGEAVANDCDFAWAEVITADKIKMWVYVAKKEDGSCGFGNTYNEGAVHLCDLTAAMNMATGEDNDFDKWAEDYTRDPGGMFAKLYTSDAEYTGGTNLGCDLYEI